MSAPNLDNFREDYDPPDDGAMFHGPHGEPIYKIDVLLWEVDAPWVP